MSDLWTESQRLMALNQERVSQMRQAGVRLAENEAAYRKALAVALMEERAKGTPVTIVGDICRGRPDIADLKMRRDAAEANYRAFAEEINVNKLRIRVIEAQQAREWSAAGMGGI